MEEILITKNGAKVMTKSGEGTYSICANNADVTVVEDTIAVLSGENSKAVITGNGGSVFNEGENNQVMVKAVNGIVKIDSISAVVKVDKNAKDCKVLNRGDFAEIEIDGEHASFYSNSRKSKVKLSGDYAQVYTCDDEEDLKLDVLGNHSQLNIKGKNVKLGIQGHHAKAEISAESYVIHHNASEGEYCIKTYGHLHVRGYENTISLDSGAKGSQINLYKGTNKVKVACDNVQLTANGTGNEVSISGNRNSANVQGDCSQIVAVGDDNLIKCSGNNQRIVACGKNKLSVDGQYSTVYWDGDGDIVFLQEGSWLTLVEWKLQEDCNQPAIPTARNYLIDGVGIKTGGVYHIEDGILTATPKKNINDK